MTHSLLFMLQYHIAYQSQMQRRVDKYYLRISDATDVANELLSHSPVNEGIASQEIRTRMPSHFLSLALLLPSVCYAFTPNPLPTPWTDKVDFQNPWPEYPRPQLVRESWQSLNGPWEYSISAPEDDQVEEEGVVIVPYCLESMLSNVSHGLQDGQVLTYRKTVHVPEDWVGKYIALNFEAVDYEAEVFVEGIKIGVHKGGFDSFTVHFSLLDPLERDVLIEVSFPQKHFKINQPIRLK